MRSRLLISLALMFGLIQVPAAAQSVLDRLKKAAEEALKKPEPKQPAQPAPSPQQPAPRTPGATANMPASSAKVETLTLAPSEPGLEFYVSPHGGHLAAVTQKGSRFVVMHDGVSGPPFDEILGRDPKQRVLFSPDGARYAYVGRAGQEYVVMVDGKELIKFPVASVHWNLRWPSGSALFPDFTSNSKHTYFMVRSDSPNGNDVYRFFWDGQAVVSKWPLAFELSLSPDGDHFAYVSAATSGVDVKQVSLVVDGKPAGYDATNPQFTADGKHLFTRTQLPGGQGVEILADGKPYVRAANVRLYIPPAGYGVVADVTRRTPGAVDTHFLLVAGKKVEGSDAAQISNVSFSPDGKHYAAECDLPMSKGKFMVIDGKKGQEYYPGFMSVRPNALDARNVLFSADSSRTVYVGMSGGKTFAVVDGEEFPNGYPSINALSFGAQGKRIAFLGVANSRDRWVVVDGKASQSNFALDDLTFSPEGSRYAYTSTGAAVNASTSSHLRLVVDGVAEEGTSVIPMLGNRTNQGVNFVFSPDGKHVVHYGQVIADRRVGLFVDGKFVPTNIRPSNPTFTPDSRHFLWFQQLTAADSRPAGFVIYVDGRPAYQLNWSQENSDLLTKAAGTWEMGPDGVLTVIAPVGDSIQRIRITPPLDTSIDTLMALGAAAGSTRGR